ncbi:MULTISPECIES: exodeoxyribonuclease V subunit alpha [Vibrio]|uniref:exodeoxyribonuclease V subunit alpha n=1 Tax=Vibrio TaxID=662 RepID=UPI002075B755|nr:MULTISPECIES: exodeoxyribonuclease V subunit alpha [Vibrio]USD33127.1 exodeoxyribonuclease V subunit alpha [Vibrio sp. SCSIO 43186]USD46196.1 exodeoxyribonuclease V subunit alpha [Vibrio sp. SCSIO 43145]USD70251.1 exodeoxyribonuclease V subunit alpha [Vibrio sp. SCSIO 43139]USD95164.1 exodeoxyribonuclease V subunit alpha [Vibrio coralliilyticus]
MQVLFSCLQSLASKGSIRQIDYQFARFVLAQSNDEYVAFMAAVLSCELGKGHICLPLFDNYGQAVDLAAKLGLFGEAAIELNQWLQKVNWPSRLESSSLVGKQGQSAPMIFDGERLYLHRYWHYEVVLASRLNSFGSPMILKPVEVQKLTELLNHLFARNYHYLFTALASAQSEGSSTPVLRQQLVCDHLDVVSSELLDWPTIDQKLLNVTKIEQLNVLDQLVPLSVCVNWQKVAAAVALTRRFAVISGGPGTGKTTTVTKLLAALITQANQAGEEPVIKLVAPTGKAAARLTESIGKAVAELPVEPALKDQIPTDASTLHRLLGAVPNSVEFRHNQHNPLHLDILVVDEASMVDLPMMYKLVDALPKHARLVLLGDKDQLASVEAGAVLGDICAFHQQGYSASQANMIAQLTGYQTLAHTANTAVSIADSLCMLQKSYRFDARSGIGQLAKAVNSGSTQKVDWVWQRDFKDIAKFPINGESYSQMIQTLVQEYSHYLQRIGQTAIDPDTELAETTHHRAKAALQLFSKCRLLCAVREGDFGITGLNVRVERALKARKLIQTQDELWYHGRPVMVVRNDHALGLYNGDIGLCLRDNSEGGERLKVFFELPDGSVKAVLPSRVPEHETAYAMTIHKSQGSEFEHTLMILPPDFTPILTRELIYTGITRAKQRLSLYADERVMSRGVKIRTERASGLVSRLQQ